MNSLQLSPEVVHWWKTLAQIMGKSVGVTLLLSMTLAWTIPRVVQTWASPGSWFELSFTGTLLQDPLFIFIFWILSEFLLFRTPLSPHRHPEYHHFPSVHQKLMVVAGEGSLTQVQTLQAQGGNIHWKQEYPLSEAARYGHLPVIQYLVTQGANIHARNQEALKQAMLWNHLEVTQYLVAQGAWTDPTYHRELGFLGRANLALQWMQQVQHSLDEKKILLQTATTPQTLPRKGRAKRI